MEVARPRPPFKLNCFRFLLISSLLLIGQLSAFSKLLFTIPLSFFNLSHWNTKWK